MPFYSHQWLSISVPTCGHCQLSSDGLPLYLYIAALVAPEAAALHVMVPLAPGFLSPMYLIFFLSKVHHV